MFWQQTHVHTATARARNRNGLAGAIWRHRMDKAYYFLGAECANNPPRRIHGSGDGAYGLRWRVARNVKAIIADCGYTSEWDEFKCEANALHIPWFPVLNAASVMSKLRDGYDFKQASALEKVKQSRIPTLFIHGSDDELVPYSMLDKLYSAAACERNVWPSMVPDTRFHPQLSRSFIGTRLRASLKNI